MRLLIQRVTEARVRVGERTVGEIGRGYCVFVGLGPADTKATAEQGASRILELRLMPGSDKPFDIPLAPDDGILLVSQFTLYADTTKGRRPSFTGAADTGHARTMFDALVAAVRAKHGNVATGEFGATMQVTLTNDGPATFVLEW